MNNDRATACRLYPFKEEMQHCFETVDIDLDGYIATLKYFVL